jgi:lipid II:glycine glycyltransferase (peptidoglycan interpeptide bridge formation enzyme)
MGTVYSITGRELDVVHQFVLAYIKFSEYVEKLQDKADSESAGDADISYDIPSVHDLIKESKTLKSMREELNMSIPVFRNYVSSVKRKGFFLPGGRINTDFIPNKNETVITIKSV